MPKKPVKDLEIGDKVKLHKPDGIGMVGKIAKSNLFKAEGGCFCIDVKIIGGPNAGKWIRDQHLAGIAEVEQP